VFLQVFRGAQVPGAHVVCIADAIGQLFANGASEAAGACAGRHPSKVVQDVTPQRSPPHDVTLQRPHGATGHVQAACHPDGAMRDLLHADQIRLEVQVETILHASMGIRRLIPIFSLRFFALCLLEMLGRLAALCDVI
jgi:hypothetical protein